MVWSMWQFCAGCSQLGRRQVKSRHRTNAAKPADGRYPDSGGAVGSGITSGLNLAVTAKSCTKLAGIVP
jgi:hypothetical protein